MKHCISNRIKFILEAEAPFTRQTGGEGVLLLVSQATMNSVTSELTNLGFIPGCKIEHNPFN